MKPTGNAKPLAVLLAAALALAIGGALNAMEWPLPDAAVARNFGHSGGGRPSLGVELAGGGHALAAADGEVIFRSSGGAAGASRFPSPLGEWVAVDHGNGLVSIYARLGEIPPGASGRVGQGDPIAPAGSSGWSGMEGCLFMVYDRRERRWVNPAMIAAPMADGVAPQIHGVSLRGEDGSLAGVAPGLSVPQGRFGIVVHATDALSYGRGAGLAPHRIIASVNGAEVGRLALETISARDGAMLSSREEPVPAGRVYAHFPALEAAEAFLSRGQAMLEVIAQDIAGNSSSFVANISVE